MHVSSGDLSGVNDTEAVFFNAVIQGQLSEAMKKKKQYYPQLGCEVQKL